MCRAVSRVLGYPSEAGSRQGRVSYERRLRLLHGAQNKTLQDARRDRPLLFLHGICRAYGPAVQGVCASAPSRLLTNEEDSHRLLTNEEDSRKL